MFGVSAVSRIILLGLVWGVASGTAWSAPRPTQAASPKRDVAELLKGELTAQKPKLGALAEWQELVFKDELLPQYPRFVRDYRPGGSGVVADIDLASMRAYLTWGPASSAKGDALKIAVNVWAEPECERCAEALPQIKRLIRQRMERRGFAAVFVEREAFGASKMTGAALNEKLSEMARKRGWAGAMNAQWQLAPVDPDSAHADEKHYQVRVFQLAILAKTELKHEGALEIMENDSIPQAAERLMSDGVTEFGSRILSVGQALAQEEGGRDLKITVGGPMGWAEYREIRGKLHAVLRSVGTLQDSLFSREKVEFSFKTLKPVGEVEALLAPLSGREHPIKVEGA